MFNLNKLSLNRLPLLFLTGIMIACNPYPETPEKVVEQFTISLAKGDCEAAIELCEETAKEIVFGVIDAGCKPYNVSIDSVVCNSSKNKTICYCYESRDDFKGLRFPYELEKIDGQWKIMDNSKDIDAPNVDTLDLSKLEE